MIETSGNGPVPAGLGLRYGPLTLRVESDDAAHLDWLREFLTPSFEAVEPPPLARTIRLRTDAAEYAAALGRGCRPGTPEVPCFWLDTGTVRLPAWTPASPREQMLFDGGARAFYRIDSAGGIEVLASGESLSGRDALMRVVRELAMTDVRRPGGLVLHAAAAAVDERVLLVAGPKGAGKTTLLVHLLCARGTRFVANDRVAIPADGPALAVRGLPTTVKLLRESTAGFPGLGAQLDASRYHHRLTLAAAQRRPPPAATVPPRRAWSLSPAQLCALVGAAPEAGGCLTAIVFPRHRPDADPIALRCLPPAEAAAAIGAAQLGSLRTEPGGGTGAPGAAPWTPEAPVPAAAAARAEARGRDLAATVPVFECSLDPRTYGDPAFARRLLDAVGL